MINNLGKTTSSWWHKNHPEAEEQERIRVPMSLYKRVIEVVKRGAPRPPKFTCEAEVALWLKEIEEDQKFAMSSEVPVDENTVISEETNGTNTSN